MCFIYHERTVHRNPSLPIRAGGCLGQIAFGWLASRPLAPWEVRPAVFRQMVIAEVIGNPRSDQMPGTPVRCRAWVRPSVGNRFDPSCTPPNDRKRADSIGLAALNIENTDSS